MCINILLIFAINSNILIIILSQHQRAVNHCINGGVIDRRAGNRVIDGIAKSPMANPAASPTANPTANPTASPTASTTSNSTASPT